MDDDLTFGASVWGADPSPTPLAAEMPRMDDAESSESNDDFDDFGTPAESVQKDLDEDGFGDFGDFGDTEETPSAMEFGGDSFDEEIPIAGPSSYSDWHPLRLDPMPSRSDLEESINDLLDPLWAEDNIAEATTSDPIREKQGLDQILVLPERHVGSLHPCSLLTALQSRPVPQPYQFSSHKTSKLDAFSNTSTTLDNTGNPCQFR
jgi:hypothetical protein